MNIENWNRTLNWLVDHSILISSTVSLILTVLACLFKITIKAFRYIVFGTIFLTFLFSLEFYVIQFGYWPFTIIPVLGILGTWVLLFSKYHLVLKSYSLILFILYSLLLLFALELSKVSMNTWGSGTIFTGVFMIVHILPLLQLLRLAYKQDNIYGMLKLATGGASLVIILLSTAHHSEYNDETVELIRNSILFLSVFLIIEGCILLLQNKVLRRVR